MNRFRTACFSLVFAAPAAIANTINLPDLGDASSAVMSPSQERKVGEDFMRKARRGLTFVEDPEVTTYLQNLGQRLVSHSDSPGLRFRFFLVSDPTINAFAVPGGFIGVHTGLLAATENEAELAAVLAHEISHITQKHIPRMLAEEQRTMPAMAALLAAAILAGRGGEAAIALAGATAAQKSINFTRASEEEADRIGIRLLADSGFDPRAMPAFFERMQKLNRLNETNLPEFLATHPVTTSRIADSRARAEQYTYRQVPDTFDFQLVRAKLRVLAPGDTADVVRAFAANVADGKAANLDAERYGYAVALLRARRYDDARTETRKLVERSPANLYYRILQAEIEMAGGHTELGLQYYANAYKRTPSYYPLAINYARALVRSRRARDAEPIIRAALESRPDDPALYEILSQAADANGKIPESHQALAENYYLRGNPNAAIEQLQLASRSAGNNFYLQSSVEARIQAIKEEVALLSGKK